MNFWEWISNLDRRWIFLLIAIVVILPLLLPLGLPVNVTTEVQDLYDFIESIPDNGKPILISCDYDPSVEPECGPMAYAVFDHCFRTGKKVIGMSLLPEGAGLLAQAMNETSRQYDITDGIDYVNMGLVPGYGISILKLGTEMHEIFVEDFNNKPITEIPLMQKVHSYDDLSLIVCIAGSAVVEQWVAYANGRYHADVGAGVTAVMAADYYPFLDTGQLVGLLGGLKGAAEYEKLNANISWSRATRGMDTQSISHMLIIALVIVGNLGFFLSKRGKQI